MACQLAWLLYAANAAVELDATLPLAVNPALLPHSTPACPCSHHLQDIPSGAEACISYGCTHKDSLALMRDYGFVQPGNLNDRVPFNAGKGARGSGCVMRCG